MDSGNQPRPFTPGTRVVIPDHVVMRAFEGETVILNMDTSLYHGLNADAQRMLDVLVESDSEDQAVDQLAKEFEQPVDVIRADLTRLCTELQERGLIEVESAPG